MSELALLGTGGISDAQTRAVIDRLVQVIQEYDNRFVARDEVGRLTGDVLAQALSNGVVGGANGNGASGGVADSVSNALAALSDSIRGTIIYQLLSDGLGPQQLTNLRGSIDRLNDEIRVRVQEEAQRRAAAVLAEAQARGTAITNERTLWQSGDDNLAQQISLITAGSGGGFDYGQVWYFDAGAEGWTAAGATLAASNGWIDVTSTGDPQLISPALSITGSQYPVVKARIKRLAGSGWQGTCYYTTAGHGVSENYKKTVATDPVPNVGDTSIVEFAMDSLTVGGNDWLSSTITGVRLDFGVTAGDVFSVDWVAIGRNAPSASMAGLLQEQIARTSADDAEAALRATLAARVDDAEAAILSEQQTRATADTAEASARTTLAATIGASSGNQVDNAEFVNDLAGWSWGGTTPGAVVARNVAGWTVGDGTAYIFDPNANSLGTNYFLFPQVFADVVPGRRYQASVYTGAHRCDVSVNINWYDGVGNIVAQSAFDTNAEEASGGVVLALYKRLNVFGVAPGNAHKAKVIITKGGTKSGTDSFAFVTRVFFSEARTEQTQPDPYAPGGNAKFIMAAIVSEQSARVSDVAAVTSTLEAQSSRIGTAEGAIASEGNTRSSRDTALASAINRIWSFVGGSTAVIEDGALANATPTAAVATRWNSMVSAVTDPNTGQIAASNILQEQRTYANNANNTFNSTWSLRASVSAGGQTVVGGFGLSAQAGAGSAPGGSVDFGVLANKFFIAAPSSGYDPAAEYTANSEFPFIVVTTPTTINGRTYQPGVYMKRASIGQAAIGSAEIQDGAITNLKIGNEIYSVDWASSGGTAGWFINKNGGATFHSIYARGDIQATSLTANTVNTDQIVGAAVTTAVSATGPAPTITITVPTGSRSISVIACTGMSTYTGQDGDVIYALNNGAVSYTIDGGAPTPLVSQYGVLISAIQNPVAGVYTFSIGRSAPSGYTASGDLSIVALLTKR